MKKYSKFDQEMMMERYYEDYDGITHNSELAKVLLDKDVRIPNLYPHYTNSHFKTARVVWGREADGLCWEYSDRFCEWDYNKHEDSMDIAKKVHAENTCAFFEKYLSEFLGYEVEVFCIMAGYNISNGYPYQIFGYKRVEN